MKLLLSTLIFMLLFGCVNPKNDEHPVISSPEAEEIVLKSIEKHGGKADWENLKSISYNKITVLFDSTGARESSMVQRHNYNLSPFEATIKWIEKGDSLRVVYKDNKAIRYVNGLPQSNAEDDAKSTVDAAMYVLFQPFKLMDPGTILHYVGKDSLDGRVVNVVKPVYEGHQPGDDEWFFYFDSATDELVANLVNHNGKISLIKNIAFDPTISLYLHQHRKSYFADRELNIQYLRAEYFYTNYKLEY